MSGLEKSIKRSEPILQHGVAHFADFYSLENVLILGRVTWPGW